MFLSVDPVFEAGNPLQMGGYTYAGDDPVNGADPSGLCASAPGHPCIGGTPPPPGSAGSGNFGDSGSGSGDQCSPSIPYCPGWVQPKTIPQGGITLPYKYPNASQIIQEALASESQYRSETDGMYSGSQLTFMALYSFCGSHTSLCGWPLVGRLFYDYASTPSNAAILVAPGGAGSDAQAIDELAAVEDVSSRVVADEMTSSKDLADLGCGMSFRPATKVLLANGKMVKISALKVGDKVLAYNTVTGRNQIEPVMAVLVHHDHDLYNLQVRVMGHEAAIRTTSNHLFWNSDTRSWIKSANLRAGAILLTPDSMKATAAGGNTPRSSVGWMWDLTIGIDHDFYIQAATSAVLVHNDSCSSAAKDGSAPSSEDTIHSTLRGGTGDRNIESGEVIASAENMYYDENGNQVYRWSQPNSNSQIVIRNPANGNILTNQLSSDVWIEQQIQSGRWYDLQGG